MRGCEDEKMFYRPPLLEEPCAQTLSGKNVRMRENFRGKPRRLKLEQMHMNVHIFKQVSPSLKGPLQLSALHGPMFLFVDRLGFSLSPLSLFPN